MEDNRKITEEMKDLGERRKAAEELLSDVDKVERFLQQTEQKFKDIPVAGDKLACIPTLISLIRSYVNKEYTEAPISSIISIVTVLIYVISPIDLIPDSIPVIGQLDDLAVIAFCWPLIEADVKHYEVWREKNNKTI